MINNFPIWLTAIDYILAILMIILCIKFVLNLFLSERSNLGISRFVSRLVNPILNITDKITPDFVVQPIIPLYLAWVILMIRLYLLPLILGYSYLGKFALIFEKDLILQIKSILLTIALNLNYGI